MDSDQSTPRSAGAGTPDNDVRNQNDVENQIAAAAEQAKEKAAAGADAMKQEARRVAEQQKAGAAEQLGGIAHAVEDAAGDLERQMPQAAEYVHDLAQRLETAASAIRERSVDDLINSANDLARKQPAVFFAGAVVTGFALSRFLKSSSPARD